MTSGESPGYSCFATIVLAPVAVPPCSVRISQPSKLEPNGKTGVALPAEPR